MLKNYITIAWRNLWKRKFFSLINIISLSIGLSASFVIGMMVYHDFTFDTFHKDGDRIYRMVSETSFDGEIGGNPGVPIPLGPKMKEEFPEVELKANLLTWNPQKVISSTTQKVSTINDRTIFVEGDYFKIFSYDWKAGNAESALSEPNQVVLTLSRAHFFFPGQSPSQIMGQVLDYEETQATVTGIVADFKDNTDLIFTEFISLPTALQTSMKGTATQDFESINSGSQLFVKLRANTDIAGIKDRLEVISENSWGEFSKKYNFKSYFRLQPLSDMHFNTSYAVYDDTRAQADKQVLLSLAGVALFLLLLGVINFINLNTAAAVQRSREIGVRKTLGSSRLQIIKQFLGETLLLTLLAAFLSIGITYFLIQVFSEFIVDEVNLTMLSDPMIIAGMLLLILVVTTLAGFYPATVLSSYKPSRVLQGGAKGSGNSNVRKGLTIFQFVIAQVFIIGTLTVGKQIHFLLNKDMGFSQQNRLYVRTPYGTRDFSKKETFQQLVERIPGVEKTSLGSMTPASTNAYVNMLEIPKDEGMASSEIRVLHADINYLELYDIPLVAGRIPRNDTLIELVLNETAVKAMGFNSPEAILNVRGQTLDSIYPIVGVMQDFNQHSLESGIEPMMLLGDTARKQWSQFGTLHIKVAESVDLSNVVAKIESVYQEVFPGKEANVKFTDETVAKFYEKDQQVSKLLKWATGLSILISCLGLLGLVVYTTERRKKEIGIRKVLGATIAQINTLLCKDFVLLIIIAFVIAAPLAFYFANDYLQNFAYRTDLGVWIFLVSILGMLFIAITVMSIRTIRVASAKSVESLKTE